MTAEQGRDQVKRELKGRLGILTLDRSKALNALDLPMVVRLGVVLADWADDPTVDAVLIRSASDRAFCAGGDVRSIGILPTQAERMAAGRAFFGAEYPVNHRINTFPKPFIALINGIAMGGGLGVSIHGSHRVVAEDLRMAMPETALGLFPDVGGTWFLNQCPGAIGRYLALIGPQIGAADALAAGLATHHVPRAAFDSLVTALAAEERLDAGTVNSVIAAYTLVPDGGTLAERRHEIDQLFASDDLEAVVDAIDAAAAHTGWVAEARNVLRRASPTSMRATWRRMVEGRGHSIGRVLADDYRMAVRIVGGHDFAEGVRAILVDKDQSPRWNPARLGEVTAADIDALLAPMPDAPDFDQVGGLPEEFVSALNAA